MLIWTVTIFLFLLAAAGWLFLKRDPDRYIHKQKAPINFFFRWGRLCHYFFKVAILALIMLGIFSLYKYLLSASNVFATAAALAVGVIVSGGKELLDKSVQFDDVISSLAGIVLGLFVISLFLW